MHSASAARLGRRAQVDLSPIARSCAASYAGEGAKAAFESRREQRLAFMSSPWKTKP